MDFRTTSSTNLPLNGYSANDAAPLSPAVDYRQIFCVSRGSSIPVLDVPEAKLSLDVRSSNLDYADIFGGFRDSYSFEELIAKPEMGPTSPNEACTPACARSPAEESSTNCSQDNTYGLDSSHEVPCQLPGEVKQFKMLYHQTNQGSNNGTTHMAQIHAVLGDESTPVQRAQCHSPVTSVESDACGSILCGDGTIEGKCSRLLPGYISKQTSEGVVKIQKQNKSFSSDRLSDANDFGLGAHPPIVPPPSSLSSDTGTFSPPYFWEEVDINSVAAASAAAVKLAIEKARARIKLATQLMEKNKEGLQSSGKLSFKDGLRTEKKRGVKVASRSKERKALEMCKNVNAPIESSDWIENEKAGQVTPGSGDGKEPLSNNETVGGELKTAQTVHVLEEDKQRETTQHFRTAKHNARTLDVNQEDHVHESKSWTNGYCHKEMRTGTANNSLEKSVDNVTKYREGEVFKEWGDSQETLHANEREHARTFVSTQEIHDKKDETKLEAEKEISAPHELDGYDEEQKEQSEPIGLLKKVEVEELEKESISSKEAMKRIENDNKKEEADDQEEYSDRSESIHEMMAEVRRLEDIIGKEDNGKRLDESHGRGENEKESEEPCKWEENRKQQKDADSGKNTEMTGDPEEIWIEVDQVEAEKKTMDTAQEAVRCHENDLEAMDYPCKHDENEHLSETKETCVHKEIDKGMGVTSETMVYEEQGRIMEISQSSFEPRGNEKVSVSVEVANDLDYSEMFDTNCMTDGALDLSEMIKQVKESNEDFLFNANGAKLSNTEINMRKKHNDPYAGGSEIVFNIEKHVNESEVSIIQEGNGNKLKTTHGKGPIPCIETEAAQQPGTSDRRDKTTEIAEGFESSQSTGKNKENHGNKLTTKEREAKDSLQKEVGLEKEHIKKLDEAKEKEKERIAVARAIREARGRAFVEARERAAMEKLTIEARGKPVTEARKRLGKASAEVNNQSSVDKDPKLRAERAAVERATSEARDRALEKSMYGNVASDGRNQAEKFPCGSRDGGMRQSFPSSNRESGPSSSCRNSDSSNHGERSEGANNHRSKAEWERQQRTTERAEKALAEKNMRDLLAQKEQAERNRLAETLDADIKRWSSGKEGNLRALLSTLHSILGPVSGWQAVGLTDMIGSGAVKKTYRRATLFVHPDKLQQRGASIEDKYMCEKVFDLLKDAWDRFNREER